MNTWTGRAKVSVCLCCAPCYPGGAQVQFEAKSRSCVGCSAPLQRQPPFPTGLCSPAQLMVPPPFPIFSSSSTFMGIPPLTHTLCLSPPTSASSADHSCRNLDQLQEYQCANKLGKISAVLPPSEGWQKFLKTSHMETRLPSDVTFIGIS